MDEDGARCSYRGRKLRHAMSSRNCRRRIVRRSGRVRADSDGPIIDHRRVRAAATNRLRDATCEGESQCAVIRNRVRIRHDAERTSVGKRR